MRIVFIECRVLAVGPNGEQGSNSELEVDSARDLGEAGPHEETPGVHALQRSAERSQRRGAHGRHDGGGYSHTQPKHQVQQEANTGRFAGGSKPRAKYTVCLEMFRDLGLTVQL